MLGLYDQYMSTHISYISLAGDHSGAGVTYITLLWPHNGRDCVSNHQPHDCLLNRLFRRRSKKTSRLRVTGLCAGNSLVNSPHKWPVTRKMFPFDDVIMAHRQVSNISRTKHLKDSHTFCGLVENEDIVRAAPTGDAPTTSEWSTILLPTKVCLRVNRQHSGFETPVATVGTVW